MTVSEHAPTGCPVASNKTDSKTAAVAAEYLQAETSSRIIRRFSEVRDLLRSGALRQAAVSDSPTEKEDPTKASIFFLQGDEHRRRRAAINPFFTTKAVQTRHLPVMREHTDRLMDEFQRVGRGELDQMALQLVASVVFEIIGLSSHNLRRTAKRIEKANGAVLAARGGIYKLLATLRSAYHVVQFLYFDVKPAIAARRRVPREDLISRLLDEGRSDREILIECLTFGLAGMGTTREFIVVAAWHLLEKEELRARFMAADEAEQTAILLEILRLEPVASMVWREADTDIEEITETPIPAGTRLALELRAANLDESEVGPCPGTLDPDRARQQGKTGAFLSFGNGEHFCPGQKVALTESRIFLDSLLRVPGVRLAREPDIVFVPPMLMSYELRNAIVACDPNR